MLENNLIVFWGRECCQAFNTIRELKNHKLVHSKSEIIEVKHESLSVIKVFDFMEEKNGEHLLEIKQEEINGGDEDSKSTFLKKFTNHDKEENSEMDVIPMESEIKEELVTFTDTVIKEEKDYGKGECNMSNLFLEQSYHNDIKKLEVVAIQKEIKQESLLEVLNETDACPHNVESSSSDNRDEDYSPSADSDLDYFPDQTLQINIRKKAQKYRNAPNSPKSRNLRMHKLRHNASKPVKCDVCGKSFPSNSYLRNHKWVHNPNKRFKCDVCEKLFTYRGNLRAHKLTHDTDKPFKCNVCEKSFQSSSSLRKHKWMHNPNKRFKCDVCEKPFTYKNNLRSHKLTHNADKPFKCDVCDKSFTSSAKLKRHQSTHNPNKRFNCDVCGKSFASSQNLKIHKLSHNASKPFKCDVCETSYARNIELRYHKWVHSANKPFKCDVCDKTYATNSVLNRHKLTHNANKHTL